MSTLPVSRASVPFPEVAISAAKPIPLSSPDVSARDRECVLAILNGTTLSLGPALPAFEAAMAEAGTGRMVLESTAAGQRIYDRMGFQPATRLLVYNSTRPDGGPV